MNSERELFIEWLKSQPHVLNVGINPDGSFMLKEDQIAWEAWQASAQRQGYKLVPKKPDANQIEKAVYDLNLSGNTDILVDIYIAMIGAVDD